MTQTRRQSAIEAAANIVVGFAISMGTTLVVLPQFGFDVSTGQSFSITLIFTALSFVRTYGLRRFFNWFFVWLKSVRFSLPCAFRWCKVREKVREL